MSKKFFLDTSVLLDSPQNLIHLHQNGENEIYISNIVIKELNGHKEDSLTEKGFHAREFARAIDGGLEESIPGELFPTDFISKFRFKLSSSDKEIEINVISRKDYLDESTSNDLKIIEISKDYGYELVTNDIYLKLEAQTMGVKSSSLKRDQVDSPETIMFNYSLKLKQELSNDDLYKTLIRELKSLKPWTQVTVSYENTNKLDFFLVTNSFRTDTPHRYKKLSEVDISKLYPVKPINVEQKFYAEMMSSDSFEIGVATGSTGSGKTLLAVEEGLRRVKDVKSTINGIIYLRNTVTANDKASELGFRKGDQDQKLSYFAYPLYGAINFIINNRGKKDTGKASDKTDKDQITEDYMKKYNVEVMDIAHARGTTIQNKWIIFDELQNASPDTVKLMGTRVGKGCKIIMLGDFKQVDHPYLTKNRNGLVTMLKLAKDKGDIAAIQLKETIRSSIAEWFDKNL